MRISNFGFTGFRKLGLTRAFDESSTTPILDWESSLEMVRAEDINIFIGRNGSGKSTVIDMIDCLRDPSKLASLPRENSKKDNFSGCKISLEDQDIFITFSQVPSDTELNYLDYFGVMLVFRDHNGRPKGGRFDIPRFSIDKEITKKIREIIPDFKEKINYWPEKEYDDDTKITEELCIIGKYLSGTVSILTEIPPEDVGPVTENQFKYIQNNPIFMYKDKVSGARVPRDVACVYLDDDLTQFQNVRIGQLPSGWLSYGRLTAWLNSRPHNSIALIEEPETHLHPTFQRLIIRRIGEIAEKNKLQVFLTSHSPVLIDTHEWKNKNVNLFCTSQDYVRRIIAPEKILDDLGVRASDILQTNGLIWVEGPSDKIYIKYWIDLYCKKHNIDTPIQGVNYDFQFYGGSILKHFSASHDEEETVKMFCLNRNSHIIIDKDHDFQHISGENFAITNIKSHKNRIIREMTKIYGNSSTWITHGYTIESYLPEDFILKYFEKRERGAIFPKNSLSKIEVARLYTKEKAYNLDQHTYKNLLEAKIHEILKNIEKWNT